MAPPRIFISHCHVDRALAKATAKLFETAFSLGGDILCTSVPELGLEPGALIDDSLSVAVRESAAFVVLLTPAALKSPYLFFELGLRVGSDKPLVPLLAKGLPAPSLRRLPASQRNAAPAHDISALYRAVRTVAEQLKLKAPAQDTIAAELAYVARLATRRRAPGVDASVGVGERAQTLALWAYDAVASRLQR